jgi:hypothetical protein
MPDVRRMSALRDAEKRLANLARRDFQSGARLMNDRQLARKTVNCLRGDDIPPEYAKEIGRRVALTATDDQFDFARNVTKLLLRRARAARRPGPKPDLEHDKRVIEAIYWVRFNRHSLGVAKAIELAAKEFRVRENVLKNGYGGHVKKFRNLKPRIAPPK